MLGIVLADYCDAVWFGQRERASQPTAASRSGGPRPAAKLWTEREIHESGQHYETRKDHQSNMQFTIVDGKKFADGFIFKTVSFKGLETKNVDPQLDELSKFSSAAGASSGGAGAGGAEAALQAIERRVKFQKGDQVVVASGELINMVGTVLDASRQDAPGGSGYVVVLPKHSKITTPLQFKPEDLRKHFELGTFVQVTGGKNEGEVGNIVKIDDADGTVTLYSDIKKAEIKAFVNDVQKASEAMASASAAKQSALSGGQYQLHDLVRFDSQLVGVVVKVEGDTLRILDMAGTVKTRQVQQINGKQHVRQDSKIGDRSKQQVGVDDNVKVVDGPYKGKTAVVKHVYKGILFCHAREVVENAGIFVVKARQVELRAVVSAAAGPGGGLGGLGGPGVGGKPAGGFAAPAPPRRRTARNDPLLGKTVKLRAGPYKGYMGVVRDVTGMLVKVELHSVFKTINIAKTDLTEVGAEERPSDLDSAAMAGAYGRSGLGNATPAYAPMTPYNDGSETPFNDGSRTPGGAFDPNVPNTPYHSAMEHHGLGGATQYGSISSMVQTPGMVDTPFGAAGSMGGMGAGAGGGMPVQTPGLQQPSIHTPAMGSYGQSVQTPGVPMQTPYPAQTPYGAQTVHTPHVPQTVLPTTPGLPQSSSIQTPGLVQSSVQTPYGMPPAHTPMPPQSAYGSSVQTPGAGVATPFQSTVPITPGYPSYQTALPMTTPMPHAGGSIATPYSGIPTPGQYATPGLPGAGVTTPAWQAAPVTAGGGAATDGHAGAGAGAGAGAPGIGGSDAWVHDGIEVEILDGTYRGDKAMITKIDPSGHRCVVKILPDGPDSFEIDTDKLRPTQPKSRDAVLIISGEHKGRVGRLANVDFDAAVVRFGREEMSFLRMDQVAKYLRDAQ